MNLTHANEDPPYLHSFHRELPGYQMPGPFFLYLYSLSLEKNGVRPRDRVRPGVSLSGCFPEGDDTTRRKGRQGDRGWECKYTGGYRMNQ